MAALTCAACLVAFLICGAGLRAGDLALTRVGAAFFRDGAAFFLTGGLRAVVAAEVFAALLLAAVVALCFVPDLGALRAGAFSEEERFTIGLGRAFLPANVRFFAEDVGEF